jgi:hypothetical protein
MQSVFCPWGANESNELQIKTNIRRQESPGRCVQPQEEMQVRPVGSNLGFEVDVYDNS